MIQWDKYFDHIFCVTYVNNGRYHKISKELDRVGILKSGIFEFIYDAEYKYKDSMYNSIYSPGLNSGWKCSTIQHLKIWNIIKEVGFKRVLILEDDIAFLKDLNKIEYALKTTDYKDITLFHYVFLNTGVFYSTACYYVNYHGAEVLVDNFNKNKHFVICDQLLMNSTVKSVTHYNGNGDNNYNVNVSNKVINYNISNYELNTADIIIGTQHHKTIKISEDIIIDNKKIKNIIFGLI